MIWKWRGGKWYESEGVENDMKVKVWKSWLRRRLWWQLKVGLTKYRRGWLKKEVEKAEEKEGKVRIRWQIKKVNDLIREEG